MKKKLLSLALACGMVFSLAACGTPANNESPAPNTESPAIGTEAPAAAPPPRSPPHPDPRLAPTLPPPPNPPPPHTLFCFKQKS